MDQLKKMSKRRKIVLICLWCLAFFFVCMFIVNFLTYRQIGKEFWGSFEDFDKHSQPWIECPIELPDKISRIVFLRRHSHPFLAEYDRKIRFEKSALQEGIEKPLPPNTGGRTRINIYYYEAQNGQGPYVKFWDRYGNYCFDLGQQVKKIPHIPLQDSSTKNYIGRLESVQKILRFISVEESKEEKIETLK